MILAIIRAIIGALFAFFIPGFLIVLIFFKELNKLQKVALAVVLSIIIAVAIGIFLGYNETMKNLTGGVTAYNVWVYELVVSGILLVIYLLKERIIFKEKTLK